MTFDACILKPRGPFHVGEREGMREGSGVFIHSDTLFSALCHSYLLLYGKPELERFLAAENGADPPLVLSSAFPYWKGKYYFPVPRNLAPPDKDSRKARFLPQKAFEKALAGVLTDADWIAGIPSPRRGEGKGEERSAPWTTDDVPKVTVSRTGGSATDEGGFYHVGLTFYKDAGLYFLARYGMDDSRRKVEAAIRLMCDEGIGGYRTVGKGQFEQPDFSQRVSIAEPESPDAGLMLSLYYPNETESQGLPNGFYDLVPRRGYVFSPATRSLRRKEVTMFSEGSVFPENGDCTARPRARGDCPRFRGKLVDVTPDGFNDHSVYRCGLAFAIPCTLPGGVQKGGGNE
jgi:CRISPR-associated protein Csm4